MQNSYVKDIQREAVRSDTDLLSLLRKCKVVASNLQSKEALRWINYELNGYETEDEVPEYRHTPGKWQFLNPFRGWCPIVFSEDIAEIVCEARLPEPISTIENLTRKSPEVLTLSMGHIRENAVRELLKMSDPHIETELRFVVPTSVPTKIVAAVRNLVLDWSLELSSEGIIDKDSDFSEESAQKGHSVSNNYFINNVGMIGNASDNSSVQNTVTGEQTLNLERVLNVLEQIDTHKSQLPAEIADDIESLSGQIRRESKSSSPDEKKITATLVSLRSVLEGAAGSLAAQGAIGLISSIIAGG